jgi:orotate phosphoribosyltransferase
MSLFTDKIAFALFDSGCLKFGSFKIKSGAESPYYIDLASLLSSPPDMCCIADLAAAKVSAIKESGRIIQKIASIELKGALILPMIGCRVDLPCVVVRKEDKAYGVTGRTAGAKIIEGDAILFFDDVISEGLSKLEGIKPLEALGGKVKELLVVVDREQGGKERIEALGIEVQSLAKISELVESLYGSKKISEEQKNRVTAYIAKH